MSLIIAIDIGGTHIRVAAYEPNSTKPVAHKRTKSLAHTPGVFDRLAGAVESIWKQGEVTAIGIASPGPLDPHTGTILDTPNIPQWTNFPVAPKLSERFGVPVYLDNDANMAGLAEWQFGAGKAVDVVVLDPPRTGCEREVLDCVIGLHPSRIVYVSCDPSTLARDARLLADGGYGLITVRPVDMFPQTKHIEAVALFKKRV